MEDWGLRTTKKWVIMGDSNIARLPTHTIPDLQIESFLGANFRHAASILAKTTSQVVVEKVVLSFGLNSKNQKAKETSIKQLQTALRKAKDAFPYSEIWIPIINFSSSLPLHKKESLQQLNSHLHRNMPYLEPLSKALFQMEEDNIHCTKDTAKAMFDHWVTYLNFKAL